MKVVYYILDVIKLAAINVILIKILILFFLFNSISKTFSNSLRVENIF